jgi:type I restriction enzyme, S subunit
MRKVKLSDVCEISSGGTPSRGNPEYFKGDIPWAKISDIENASNGVVYETEEKISIDGLKNIRGKLFPQGTLLFAMYGSIGKVGLSGIELSTNQAILGIRPRTNNEINLNYLKTWFVSNKQQLINQGRGAALKNLSATIIRDLEIELPSVEEQIRISHLLGRVERLIAERKKHLRQLDDLLKSVFLEIFGDPVRNEKAWDTLPFSQIGKFTSGGTPSKSRDDFWTGNHPWVSPKDMKVSKIFDAEDHISTKVFDETPLKSIPPGHLLIVVRGMILAHSFPIAINMVDVAINQDMKAIKLKNELGITYIFYCLNALKRQILKLVTTAGHGTKKFDSDAMEKLLVPVPPPEMQDKFQLIADKIEQIQSSCKKSLTDLENLYGALSQKAFRGELDLSFIPLPSEQPTEARTETAEPLQKTLIHDLAIDLPDAGNMPDALENAEAREQVISHWLVAYRNQLGGKPFSVQKFMAAAQTRISELHPDNDFELSSKDYDQIKAWVFKAQDARMLTQEFDATDKRIKLRAARA